MQSRLTVIELGTNKKATVYIENWFEYFWNQCDKSFIDTIFATLNRLKMNDLYY